MLLLTDWEKGTNFGLAAEMRGLVSNLPDAVEIVTLKGCSDEMKGAGGKIEQPYGHADCQNFRASRSLHFEHINYDLTVADVSCSPNFVPGGEHVSFLGRRSGGEVSEFGDG